MQSIPHPVQMWKKCVASAIIRQWNYIVFVDRQKRFLCNEMQKNMCAMKIRKKKI